MTTLPAGLNADEFWDWCCRPEHEDRAFELDRGRVIERPYPGTELHGTVCALVSWRVGNYLFDQLRRGYGCCNNVGLLFERNPGSVFCPDLLVYTRTREEPFVDWFATAVPDLVVEVVDTRAELADLPARVERFHRAGVPLVWAVCGESQSVAPLTPGSPWRELSGPDVMTGSNILPDFCCKVSDLFALPGASPPAAP